MNKKRAPNTYISKIEGFRTQDGIFTTGEARKAGISARLLSYYCDHGRIVRLSHGLYRLPDTFHWDDESIIREKLKVIPQGIVGLKSALRMYGLTVDLQPAIQLLVPRNNVPKRKIDDVILIAMSPKLLRIGVQVVRGIPVTNLERTLIDLLRRKQGLGFVLQIVKEAQRSNVEVRIPRILEYGRRLRQTEAAKYLVDGMSVLQE